MPVLNQDIFNPTLILSPALIVTEEQVSIIRRILLLTSADTQLAQKAADVIIKVLTAGLTAEPVITSLVPGQTTVANPSFNLHVRGREFNLVSQILWNGDPLKTTYVSTSELVTFIDMSLPHVGGKILVRVLNSGGVVSDAFVFNMKTLADSEET